MNLPGNRKSSDYKLDPRLKEGTVIAFERRDKQLKGMVVSIRENTVMIKVDEHTQKFLELENEFTIVHHKKYKVGN